MSVTDQSILDRLNKARASKEKKAPKPIAKISEKKKAKDAEEKKARSPNKREETGLITLDEWFLDRRNEMTGKCLHCGGRSCKHDPLYYKHSIGHILPKNLFASVATHPLNWLELCFWEKNCHGNYDAKILDLINLNCFDLVIERFVAMYPDIDPKERRHIPDVLLQYIKTNS